MADLDYAPTEAYAKKIYDIIRRAGFPDDANRWLIRALQPSAMGPLGALPDETLRTSVRVGFQPTTTIQAPPSVPDGELWDLCIVSPPGDCIAAMWCAAPAGADFTKQQLIENATVGTLSFTDDYTEQTVINDASYTSIQDCDARAITLMPNGQYSAFRLVGKGITAEVTASDLYNGGRVYAGQYPVEWEPRAGAVGETVPDGEPFQFYMAAVSQAYVPLEEQALAQLSPGYYRAKAKDGVYIPQRRTTVSQPFVSRRPWVGLPVCTPQGGAGTGVTSSTFFGQERFYVSGSVAAFSAPTVGVWPEVLTGQATIDGGALVEPPGYANWVRRATRGTGDYLRMDSGYDSYTTGVTIFRGLDRRAVITLSGYGSMEFKPYQTSPFMPLMQPSPAPCPQAIELYFQVVAALPMAFPSEMNFLGGLLPILGRLIMSALRVVKPVVVKTAKAAGKAAVSAAVPIAASAALSAVGQRKKAPERAAPAGNSTILRKRRR